MKKILLKYILLLLCLCTAFVFANPVYAKGSDYTYEGSGTKEDPYLISSKEELLQFQSDVNEGTSFSGICFLQTADIDLDGIEWTPIGIYGEKNYFRDVYNGGGHVIKNLVTVTEGNNGFFGLLQGTVMNLGIESGCISGSCCGGITSHGGNGCLIINCYNRAAVDATDRAGGIGDNLTDGTVINCWSDASLSADVTGGIVSYNASLVSCCFSSSDCVPSETFSGEVSESTATGDALKNVVRKLNRNLVTLIFSGDYQELPALIQWNYSPDGETIGYGREISGVFYGLAYLYRAAGRALPFIALAGLLLLTVMFLIRRRKEISIRRWGRYSGKAAAFILIGLLLFGLINKVFTFKGSYGVTELWSFYQQEEESIDVLLLGSSHAGMNLDAAWLWDSYGISAYALWGSAQPFWNSYYFLKEALKSQQPEVVVLDVEAASYTFEYSDNATQAVNITGLRFSMDRLRAVTVSAPQERWVELFFGLPVFHSRYTELTENDFSYFVWSDGLKENKGSGYRYGTTDSVGLSDVSGITDVLELYEKEELWLRKIIELCLQEEIPIVLCKTPVADREYYQPYWNAVQEIADEYGIDFYNFALYDEETGFDSSDFYLDDSHLNTSGARKISEYLGQLLTDTYELADHRGDSAYESWEVFSENISNGYLQEITQTADYAKELERKDRKLIFVVNGSWEQTDNYLEVMSYLSKFGLSEEISDDGAGIYVCESSATEDTEKILDGLEDAYLLAEEDSIEIQDGGLLLNGTKVCEISGNGLWCITVDKETGDCIDVAAFLQAGDFVLQRQ
ncbi:MAG: hypothetical protein LUI14_01790 [Lachnospiraceae bacterium]|nr:hypothetical protein [Lachnospiraceae bacterium]